MDPKDIVRTGYDKVTYAYRSESFDYEGSMYKTFLGWLESRLPPNASVLDLGCGIGIPVSRELSRTYTVTGVDLSPVQIERAKQLVPPATFLCADMTQLEFPPHSFDAIVAFYSIIHIPLPEQPALFAKIARWLKPGGYLLASVGYQSWTGTEPNWHDVEGATMYWSHSDAAAYRTLFSETGFTIEQEGFVPEGDGGHTVLLGKLNTT